MKQKKHTNLLKLLFSLLLAVVLVSSVSAQEEHQTKKTDPLNTTKFGGDVIIDATSGIDNRDVDITVAFNGWMFSAYTTYDAVQNAGGITIQMSKDNGYTWTLFSQYSVAGRLYRSFDLIVTGSDTSNLRLFVAGIYVVVATNQNAIYLDKYNATTGDYMGSFYNLSTMNSIYDIAIASDYMLPAVGAAPYSIALVYSRFGGLSDSIISVVSPDSAATFDSPQLVATTYGYFRNVSIAYGKSYSGSNGRYFVAYDQFSSFTDPAGHVFASRTYYYIEDVYIKPTCLDSLSIYHIGLCRNPTIACLVGNVDSDSSGVSELVLYQRAYNGSTADWDVMGWANKRAHYSNNWDLVSISNNSDNCLQPDASFDPTYNNFLVTYYDSTGARLPYCWQGFNLPDPTAWTFVTFQYNDSPNLANPKPKVKINLTQAQAVFVWAKEGPGSNGIAMFEAEYSTLVSVRENQDAGSIYMAPNPAADQTMLHLNCKNDQEVTIEIYTLNGQKVMDVAKQNFTTGNYAIQINTSQLSAGTYICRVQTGTASEAIRLCVLR